MIGSVLTRRTISTITAALVTCAALAQETTDAHGVAFAPTPDAAWTCGLTNEQLPGLAEEGMRQPIAAGCRQARQGAIGYVVIVDLSDSRTVMRAEQMATDAEDQLPSSWKIESKSYEVISLPNGTTAAHSKLVGKGTGYTFHGGQSHMVAVSANVPLTFEDAAGIPRHVIAVFRIRSPLPADGRRSATIAALDRTLEEWASTVRLTGGRMIPARDFELAAYGRDKARRDGEPTATAAAAPGSRAPTHQQRLATAVASASSGSATPEDLRVLEEAAKSAPDSAIGAMAASLVDDTRRAAYRRTQEEVLAAAVEAAGNHAATVLARFLDGAIATRDTAAVASAARIARRRGVSLAHLPPSTVARLTKAVLQEKLSIPISADDRLFFDLGSAALLGHLRSAARTPAIEDVARRDGDAWRLKGRRPQPPPAVVQFGPTAGVLERAADGSSYRYRELTNLLDAGERLNSTP